MVRMGEINKHVSDGVHKLPVEQVRFDIQENVAHR